MKAARGILIGLGAVGLGVGAWLMVTTNRPAGLIGVAVWLAAAVVLHDAILSPVLFGIGWVLRLMGGRIPLAVLAVVQVAAIIGAVGSLILLPEIHAKALRQRNPTVLPLDYALNLAGMWVVLAIGTAIAIVLVVAIQRRRTRRRVAPELPPALAR